MIGFLTAWFTMRYRFALKELQRLQIDYSKMTAHRNVVQALANEAVEYSKTNPAIDPILFEFDLKPTPVITSFRMSVYRQSQGLMEMDGTGNRFTEKMVNESKKTRSGDKVYIDYIRVKMPDGPRSLPPVNFVLN